MNSKHTFLIACGVFLLETGTTSFAQGVVTYLNNVNAPVAGNITLGSAIGMQFQTGANPNGYILANVQFLFGDAVGNPNPAGLYLILTADSSGGPGASVAVFNQNNNPTSAGYYTFTPNSTANLSGNSFYWLQLVTVIGSLNDSYQLNYTDTSSAFSSDGWNLTGNTAIGQPGIPIFSISATPVPEPCSFGLLTVGLLTGITLSRRSRIYIHSWIK